MTYKLPLERKLEVKSSLEPFFQKVRGAIVPGAFRLQKLLTDWLAQGILNIPSILVTGSNGKGTTCSFVESILREHGLKTGLYTSPHLIHPNERMRINGEPISETILEENIDIIKEATKKYLPDASFFEISTATALLIFLKQNVEFLVCEVGLGGKFDSTNAIAPIASALTNVSLEHTDYLGDTLYKIAYDKSHVSRRNKPFIIGELPAEARQGVYDACNLIGSNIFESAFNLNKKYKNILNNIENSNDNDEFNFPKMNIKNLRLSLTIINELEKTDNLKYNFSENKISKAISKTYWPGRFDIRTIHNRKVIFDASHNPEGFAYFTQQYQQSLFKDKNCVLVFASLNDKNWKKSLEIMPKISKNIIFTQIASERSESIEHFSQYIEKANLENNKFALSPQGDITCQYFYNLDSALETAMNHLADLPLVITGSIAFIGTVMQRFGLSIFRGNE
ncbi:bifunctional folylpolyglutamate synthase/dihydrofolate synthase [Fluviispira vulneris]|uniref:bifunctional folylpolyglutamate synthase/dihydrofolate synthase n=1 Tax=Fluviispira vulneris TaxID=2763012 RepID=UPI001645EB8E|nr:Mur ligase family protein [Fluviispira vulneris]